MKTAIQKIHKDAISNVQKHMKKCHGEEYQTHLDNAAAAPPTQYWNALQSNKKQRTVDCSFFTKEQKGHAVSVFEQRVYEYSDDSVTLTSKGNIEKTGSALRSRMPAQFFKEEALLLVFVL